MLEHKGTARIETERLILRRAELSDAQVLFDTCFSLPEVTQFMRYDAHRTVQDSVDIINIWIDSYKDPKSYNWVVALKENDRPIGTLGCVDINDHDQSCEIGFQLAREQWGNGYMTEAVTAVINFLFKEAGFNRIQACHSVNNPASGAVMRRCGMQFEGMAREKYYCAQGYQDSNQYAIIKSDLAR